jgi:hypothetical protein
MHERTNKKKRKAARDKRTEAPALAVRRPLGEGTEKRELAKGKRREI